MATWERLYNGCDVAFKLLKTEHTALQKKYNALEKKFKKMESEAVIWGVRDFMDYELDGYEITKKQAERALKDMLKNHDANNGINWITLEHYYEKWGTTT